MNKFEYRIEKNKPNRKFTFIWDYSPKAIAICIATIAIIVLAIYGVVEYV